jgi:uncharacterized membrane protein
MPVPPGQVLPDSVPDTAGHGLRLTADGRMLIANGSMYDLVAFFALPEMNLLGWIPVGDDPNWITLTPDGKHAYVSNRASDELYQFWRNFENLPQFMYHLKAVRVIDDRRSHWEAKAPAGKRVQWDAEITNDQPNEEIAWQSTFNADVPNSGRVRFEPGPAGRGTVVRVEIEYRPPGGAIGKVIAKLFGEEPGQQVAGDLHRFKQVMETGEVLRSDGSMQGYGQKMQQPARPTLRSNGGWMTRPMPEQEREQARMRE